MTKVFDRRLLITPVSISFSTQYVIATTSLCVHPNLCLQGHEIIVFHWLHEAEAAPREGTTQQAGAAPREGTAQQAGAAQKELHNKQEPHNEKERHRDFTSSRENVTPQKRG